jgi:hypothetical protein
MIALGKFEQRNQKNAAKVDQEDTLHFLHLKLTLEFGG